MHWECLGGKLQTQNSRPYKKKKMKKKKITSPLADTGLTCLQPIKPESGGLHYFSLELLFSSLLPSLAR